MLYRCFIVNADGEILIDREVEGLDMGRLAGEYGLKREFLAAFIRRSDQGRISNPAGVGMTWRKV